MSNFNKFYTKSMNLYYDLRASCTVTGEQGVALLERWGCPKNKVEEVSPGLIKVRVIGQRRKGWAIISCDRSNPECLRTVKLGKNNGGKWVSYGVYKGVDKYQTLSVIHAIMDSYDVEVVCS